MNRIYIYIYVDLKLLIASEFTILFVKKKRKER